MKNTITPRGPKKLRTAPTRIREVLDNEAARPLPELTTGQKAIARLIGGRAIERFTGEQLRHGTERNLRDIKELFDKDPSSEFSNFHISNELTLSHTSAVAGLPSTRVRLHEVDKPSPHSVLTFFSPDDSETPPEARTLLDDPIFKVTDESVSLSLRSRLEPTPRPLSELSRQEQMLAYMITADVAETMQAAQRDGTLAIQAG